MKFNELMENVKAVTALEKMLKNPQSYEAIDAMMKSIAKKYKITPGQLHDYFVDQNGQIPDNWIKSKLKEDMERDEPFIRKVVSKNPDGSEIVTYEVVSADGVTIKTGMSKWVAKSFLNSLEGR